MMPITYEKGEISEISPGLYNQPTKIIVDDFTVPYEKDVTLEYRPDRPEVYEKNLSIQTDLFVAEIKKAEAVKKIDVSKSLDKVAISANEKYRDKRLFVVGVNDYVEIKDIEAVK